MKPWGGNSCFLSVQIDPIYTILVCRKTSARVKLILNMTRPIAKQKQWLKAGENTRHSTCSLTYPKWHTKPEAKGSLSAMWLWVVICFEPGMWAIWFPTGKPVGGSYNASTTRQIWHISHHWPENQPWYWEQEGNKKECKWREELEGNLSVTCFLQTSLLYKLFSS